MTRAIAKTIDTISLTHTYRRYVVLSLLAGCAFMAVLYIYNVYSLISRTVALQHATQNVAALDAAVNNLDAEYLELSSHATPDSVVAHGMTQGQVSLYINRSSSFGRVAMVSHEL